MINFKNKSKVIKPHVMDKSNHKLIGSKSKQINRIIGECAKIKK